MHLNHMRASGGALAKLSGVLRMRALVRLPVTSGLGGARDVTSRPDDDNNLGCPPG